MNKSPQQLWHAAQRCLAQNDAYGARTALFALIALDPISTHAHLLLGGIAHAQGQLRAATQHALDASRHLPDDASQIASVVNALLLVGEIVAARASLEHPAIARCRNGQILASLASVRQMLGEHAAALALLDRALAAGLDNPDIRYLRGVQLTFNGRLDAARSELATCLRRGPTYGRAWLTLARLDKQSIERNHLTQINAQIAHVAKHSEDHAALEFARYKELEDCARNEEAWQALVRGNAIMYARLRHDAQLDRRLTEQLIALSTPEFLHAATQPCSGPQPIFIIGMPRSGTTVLDRILGNHSQVTSAGELGDFSRQLRWAADHVASQPIDAVMLARAPTLDYAAIGARYLAQTQWRANGKAYFVDKLPINYVQAGFIARALPHARILHMTREPMDVCFSNFKAFFGEGYGYSYNLDALAAHYADYRRLMRHWHAAMPGKILDVSYAALVAQPEQTAREVFAFCDLPFEAGAIDIGNNAAPVATLSAMQVREGIHKRAQGEWQRYATQLAPLANALATAT